MGKNAIFCAAALAAACLARLSAADFYISTAPLDSAFEREESALEIEGIVSDDSEERRLIDLYNDVVPRVIAECAERGVSVEETSEKPVEDWLVEAMREAHGRRAEAWRRAQEELEQMRSFGFGVEVVDGLGEDPGEFVPPPPGKLPLLTLGYKESPERGCASVSVRGEFDGGRSVSYAFTMSDSDDVRLRDVAARFACDFILQFSREPAVASAPPLALIDVIPPADPGSSAPPCAAAMEGGAFAVSDSSGVRVFSAAGEESAVVMEGSPKFWSRRLSFSGGSLSVLSADDPFVRSFGADGRPLARRELNAPPAVPGSRLRDVFADGGGAAFFADFGPLVTVSCPNGSAEFEWARDFCSAGTGGVAFQVDDAVFVMDENADVSRVVFLPEGAHQRLLRVLGDGSLLVLSGDSVSRVFADGSSAEVMRVPASLGHLEVLSEFGGMLVCRATPSRSLVRIALSADDVPGPLREVAEASARIAAAATNSARLPFLRKRAEAYVAAGGNRLALADLGRYLEFCPADAAAAEMRLRAECAVLRAGAAADARKALAALDELGPESARGSYSSAMVAVEKILRYDPSDEEARRLGDELRAAFGVADGHRPAPSVSVEEVSLGAVFPALQNVYATDPAGFVAVRNRSDSTLRNVRASVLVRRFMDFESFGVAEEEVAPGGEAQLPLMMQLNDNALSLAERTNVQARIAVSWEEDGSERRVEVVRPLTVLGRNAMSWEDTAMLSCFIMPNDESVRAFSFAASAGAGKSLLISRNISRAVAIVDSLGSVPLAYVPDPVAPAAELSSVGFAVDTVRFPAETMELGGGDCDDLTTLFCSAVESVGIPAALVTTPGHIFAAFDTGLRFDGAWAALPDGLLAVERDGRAWIPVEITAMQKGFAEAWRIASGELSEAGEDAEFVVVAESRTSYPPVRAGGKRARLSVDKGRAAEVVSADCDRVRDVVLRATAAAASSAGTAPELNALARTLHLLGDDDGAVAALERALELDPDHRPTYANLANLHRLAGDGASAAQYAATAATLNALSLGPLGSLFPPEGSGDGRASEEDGGAEDFEWEE